MKPEIKQVLPLYPHDVHIQWVIYDKTGSCKSVDLLRSESPLGPFEVIESNLDPSFYFYVDTTTEVSGLTRKPHYIIRANSVHSEEDSVLSEVATTDYDHKDHRARIARKARRDLKVTLSRLNGVKVALLKKKTFGPRCTYCYNPDTKDTLVSQCPNCYGTSYVGGYHDPVYTWGKLDPVAIQSSLGTSGKTETGITGLTIVDYPRVSTEDVVVELRTNRRFKVQRIMVTESSRVLVHQDLQVSELSRSSAEYLIPVDLTTAEVE
jgi:hypothetical protein